MIKILLDILLFALGIFGFWILVIWIFTEIIWDVDKDNSNKNNKQDKES